MIVIVDSGLGNVGSVANMLRKVTNQSSVIARDVETIKKASKIILPGVGHFDKGMENLDRLGLTPILTIKATEEKVPFLGICLGMQMMGEGSEEGTHSGLGWIKARFRRFHFESPHKLSVPHMGWNWVRFVKRSPLTDSLQGNHRFYFVHSFHMATNNQEDVLGLCQYGYSFPAAFHVENLYGVQFHPEKSHRFGMALMKAFTGL